MKTFMIIFTLQLFNCISNGHIIAKNDGTSLQSKEEVAAKDQSLLNYLLGILDNQTETADDALSSGRLKRSASNYYQNIPLVPIPSPFVFNYFPEYLQPPLRPHAPKIENQTPHLLYPKVHRKELNSILKHLYAKFNRILKPLESKTRVHGTRKPVRLGYNFNVNSTIQKQNEMDSGDLKKSNAYEPIKLKTSIHDEVKGEPFVNIPQTSILTPLSSTEVKTNKKSSPMGVKHETDNMFVKINAPLSINDKHHDVKHDTLQSDGTKHNDNGNSWNLLPEIVQNEVTRQLEEILRKYQFDKTNDSNGKIVKSNKPNNSIDNKKNITTITTNVDDDETQNKIEAKSIFGNFVGNKHFANIFVLYPNESIFVKLSAKPNEKTQDSDADKNEIVSYKENSQIAAKKEKIINNNDKDKNNTVSDTVEKLHRNENFIENDRFGDITKERDVKLVEFNSEGIIEMPTEKPNEKKQDSDVHKNEIVSYKENSQIADEKEKTNINNDKDENNTVTSRVDEIHRNEDFNVNDRSGDITKEKDVELVEFTTESIIETPTEKLNEETQKDSNVYKNVSVSYEENSQTAAEKEKTIINNDKDENNTVTDTINEIHQNKDFDENERSSDITKERDINNKTTVVDKFSTTEANSLLTTESDVETTTNTIEVQTEENLVNSSEITTGYSENFTTIELTEGSDGITVETTNTGIETVDEDKSNIITSTVASDIEVTISEDVLETTTATKVEENDLNLDKQSIQIY